MYLSIHIQPIKTKGVWEYECWSHVLISVSDTNMTPIGLLLNHTLQMTWSIIRFLFFFFLLNGRWGKLRNVGCCPHAHSLFYIQWQILVKLVLAHEQNKGWWDGIKFQAPCSFVLMFILFIFCNIYRFCVITQSCFGISYKIFNRIRRKHYNHITDVIITDVAIDIRSSVTETHLYIKFF